MSFSDFLFARGGFLSGVARAFDLAGGMPAYNYAPPPEQVDLLAMYADWCSVGDDMGYALARAAQESEEYQLPLFDQDIA